jgi:acyl transferase domain-containing protein/NADPH:quinone reductase-like Zn-dependent oxidoreductase/acyl carrier protein
MAQKKSSQRVQISSEQPQANLPERLGGAGEPIAIVGLSCRFPSAPDQQAFWELLRDGRDAIREVPLDRHWDKSQYYSSDPNAPGKMYTWEGGFLEEFERFDAGFFGISPREAAQMDPQQRLLLETVYEAFEDGGQALSRLEATSTGVYVGISTNDFLQIGCRLGDPLKIDSYSGTGSAASVAAGRISFCLGLQGPNFPVDTACSSSLVALHLACQSLRNEECRIAVVAAVNLMLSPETTFYFCKVRALAPDGRCKAFDASANGYGRSEGAGAVVVKRLSDAQADGDRILAVIRGSAINHDGRTTGLTVPNGDSQERLIRKALANAGLHPEQVSYVEAHGTGTPLGDPIEFRAIRNTYCSQRDPSQPLLIGSVKTNIGHAEAAAGIAGLIKVVLSLQHRKLPPHLHFNQPNPYISWGDAPLEVVTGLRDWEPLGGRRIAGLSSFGFSGTNAHVIVEEYNAVNCPVPSRTAAPSTSSLVTVSAKSGAALGENLSRLKSYLDTTDNDLEDIAYTLAYGKSHFAHRWSCVANSHDEVISAIDEYLQAKSPNGKSISQSRTVKAAGKVAWVFGGQGAQAVGMGRQLFDSCPVFRRAIEECDAIIAQESGQSLVDKLYGQDPLALQSTTAAHTSLLAFEYGLVRRWQSWGLSPSMVTGHSLGEFVAGIFAGIFSLEDALKFVSRRGALIDQKVEPGKMLAVAAAAQVVGELIDRSNAEVSIAAINSPRVTVVAGSQSAIADYYRHMEDARISCKEISAAHAFHSASMDTVLEELRPLAEEIQFRKPRIGFVASTTGDLNTQEVATPEYWVRQIRLPTQFLSAVQTLAARNYDVFLEINAAPVLTGCAKQSLPKQSNIYIASLHGGEDCVYDFSLAAAELYRHQVDFDWRSVYREKRRKILSIPTYAFQRESLTPAIAPQKLWRKIPVFNSTEFASEEPLAEPEKSESAFGESNSSSPPLSAADCIYRLEWRELSPATLAEGLAGSPEAPNNDAGTGALPWLLVYPEDTVRVHQISEALATRAVVFYTLLLPRRSTDANSILDSFELDEVTLDAELLRLGSFDTRWAGVLYIAGNNHVGQNQISSESIMRFEQRALSAFLGWIRCYQRRPLPYEPRWIILTTGVHQAVGLNPVTDSGSEWWHASLWGLGRVLNLEQPQWRCQFIDLDKVSGAEATEGQQAALGSESLLRTLDLMQNALMEDQISICNGKIYIRRLVRDERREQRELPLELRGDRTYLITGGTGGLGLLLVERLLSLGVKSMALIGRSLPTGPAEEALRRWRTEGREVQFHRCDVTDWRQVEDLFAKLDCEQKQIDGIFHLAGTLDDDYLAKLDWSRFEPVMRPKVMGAWNLHRATLDRSVSYFVCFSSVASVFGGLKQGNYAAANAWVDRLMLYRQNQGLSGLSINWGPWEEAGMAARLGNRQFQGWASVGIQVLPTAVGFDDLIRTLNSTEAQIPFVPVNWARALQFFPPGLEPPLFRGMALTERKQLKPSNYWKSYSADLAKLPRSEQRELTLDYLESHVGDVLGIPKSRKLETDSGFVEQGMDSLMAIDLRSRLQVDLGLQHILPVSFVLDYPSLSRMANYYLAKVAPRIHLLGHSGSPSASSFSPETIEPLSDTALKTEWKPLPLAEWRQEETESEQSKSAENPSWNRAARVRTGDEAANSLAEPIAIIGMSCRFPGGINSPEQYWQALCEGRDSISEVPRNRWDVDAWYDPNPDAIGKINCRYGGFLQDVETFDAAFFGVSPREALRMDPQQRILLEMTIEVLEDALLPPDSLRDSNTSVALGISGNDYLSVLRRANDLSMLDGWLAMGNALSIAAGRISHTFGWHGPCAVLDTACSSSLAAIYTACMSLRNRQTDLAVAGASNLILGPEISISLTKAHALSRDGRCKTFDATANGYVRSEGIAMVALKRLSDAMRDANPVHAIIHGVAMNHDGHSSGLTVPSVSAQEALIRRALADAKRTPDEIGYIEAHGTGTPLGDPIEMQAIGKVFRSNSGRKRELLVGSVKANLGHLEAAAGIAGLMKVVLALRHQSIPPQLHFRQPSPAIPWSDLPVRIPVKVEKWRESSHPRLAGVSSFGFSGTNLHLIVGEAYGQGQSDLAANLCTGDQGNGAATDATGNLLCISAKTDSALRELAEDYLEFFNQQPEVGLGEVCYSASIGRTHYPCRLMVIANNPKQASENIALWLEGKTTANVQQHLNESGRVPKLACLFTGQGSQYAMMGQHLMQTQPVFRRSMLACDAFLRKKYDLPLLELLYGGLTKSSPRQIDQTSIAQPALYSLEASLIDLWKSWGVQPNAVLGHSVGEFAAAYAAGVFSREGGLILTAERGKLMDSISIPGAMAIVFAPKSFVEAAIEHQKLSLSIAAVNGPLNTVVSGELNSLQKFCSELEKAGMQCKQLAVSQAFHSQLMESIQPKFLQIAQRVDYHSPAIGIISNITGGFAHQEMATPEYWTDHIRKPVLFAEGVKALHERNYRTFLEIGPDGTLIAMGRHLFNDENARWVSSLRKQADGNQQLLRALGSIALSGVAVDWQEVYRDAGYRKVAIPKYAFQRKRYWPVEQDAPDNEALAWLGSATDGVATPTEKAVATAANGHTDENKLQPLGDPLVGRRFESQAFRGAIFEKEFSIKSPNFLQEHKVHSLVVVPGAAYLSMAVAALTHDRTFPIQLSDVSFPEPLFLTEQERKQVQVVLDFNERNREQFRVYSKPTEETSSQWRLHAVGLLQATQRDPGSPLAMRRPEMLATDLLPAADPLDFEAVQTRCSEHIPDTNMFYDIMARTGVELGGSFRWNKEVWRCDGESLSHLIAPPELANDSLPYYHPGLVDSCIQSAALAMPKNLHDFNAYIPVQVQRFTGYRQAEKELWCLCRVTEDSRKTNGSLVFDVKLYNTSGQKVFEMSGLRMQRAPRTAISAFAQRKLRDWMYRLDWIQAPLESTPETRADGKWIIFADSVQVAEKVAKSLTSRGGECVLVKPHQVFQSIGRQTYGVNPEKIDDFQALFQAAMTQDSDPIRGVVFLWPVKRAISPLQRVSEKRFEAAQRIGTQALLNLLKAIGSVQLRTPPNLWVVTRKTQTVLRAEDSLDIDQASLWGFCRVAALEFPHMKMVRVDLDTNSTPGGDARQLIAEIGSPTDEDQVAYRKEIRYVARLAKGIRSEIRADRKAGPEGTEPYRLIKSEKNSIEELTFQTMNRINPAIGEIEIGIRATGLNFRDVLNALGLYPGEAGPLGFECAGIVTGLGSDVRNFALGDRVLAIAPGAIGPYVLTDTRLAVRLPDSLSFEDAATIPIVFLTVEIALCDQAQLRAGETVLIHSSAGGVGLAAIQAARYRGARIIATAGSEVKRNYVRELGIEHVFDSRSPDFPGEVLAATGNRGVDVVLNALPGEFVGRSVKCLANNGRFVEIGKSKTWEEEGWETRRPDIQFARFALDELAVHQPTRLGDVFAELMSKFESGVYRPLPRTDFEIGAVRDAFRYMAQAKHIGKVIIRQAEFQHQTQDLSRVKEDATYLITGGLGGIGLLTARWLADRGAKHLVLAGRRAPNEEARKMIDELNRREVKVSPMSVDLASQSQVKKMVRDISKKYPPLRGVVHGAGILDDGVVVQQDWPRFQKAMHPKTLGMINLHNATKDLPLDWLIIYSSIASLWGSPGQANYAAANAMLDAFASARRLVGLPALGINWGPWAEIGMAAKMEGAGRHWWEVVGIGMIPPSQGIAILELLLQEDASQTAILPIDWQRIIAQLPKGIAPPLIRELVKSQQRSLEPSKEWLAFVAKLTEAPPTERIDLLVQHTCQEVARILGLESAADVNPHLPLKDLGLDSLMAVELANQLTNSTGITLPMTLMFDFPTIHAISGYIVRNVLLLDTGELTVEATESEI